LRQTVALIKCLINFTFYSFNIEIAGGLGETVGKVFRIGVMGVNAQTKTVDRTLEAFEASVQQQKASM
jgi:alanine-glyoxylate transaminase/serine-glyoxylate transaminase/serine-pyruvate transaminase